MPITVPTTITSLPTPPSTSDPTNFDSRADAFLAALPTFTTQTNTAASDTYTNALETYNNLLASMTIGGNVNSAATAAASSASAAAGSAGAALWVSGTTYSLGNVVYSPITYRVYRRAIAGAGTTDPSADGTNWKPVDTAPPSVIVTTTTQTAVAGTHYVLTNIAATTLSLPASPAAGDIVWVTVANGLRTNIVARNTKTIVNLAEDMTLNTGNDTVSFRYLNSTWMLTGIYSEILNNSSTITTPITYSNTLTGGTGLVNIGSGQFYKDASGNIGIGTAAPSVDVHLYRTTGGSVSGGRARVLIATPEGSITLDSDGGTNSLTSTTATNTFIIYGGAKTLYFGTNGIGNVLAPVSDLHIVGTTGITLASGTTANTTKTNIIKFGHYLGSAYTAGIMSSATSTANILYYGGAMGTPHAATQHSFHTATTYNSGGGGFERFRVDSIGNTLNVSNAGGGIGYGTGSGGGITQTTSRTTSVTINKTNGSITLVSAAGSASWQTFTVNNSTVAATDVIILSQRGGTDKYMLNVTSVSSGFFTITYATTGGTTTESPVFNFAVIKAVVA